MALDYMYVERVVMGFINIIYLPRGILLLDHILRVVSTTSQENAPRALEINPDGTKFFVAGTQTTKFLNMT